MPNRDDYFRCPHCKKLFHHDECTRDEASGIYICPSGCRHTFVQPPYEGPLTQDA